MNLFWILSTDVVYFYLSVVCSIAYNENVNKKNGTPVYIKTYILEVI